MPDPFVLAFHSFWRRGTGLVREPAVCRGPLSGGAVSYPCSDQYGHDRVFEYLAPTVLLEGATVSEHILEGLVEAAGAFTQLGVQTSLNAANRDHVPFIEAGKPAVLTIEGTDRANGRVHTPTDLIQHLNYDLMLA